MDKVIRLGATLLLVAIVTACQNPGPPALSSPNLGPQGVDCGPVAEPQCSETVDAARKQAHAMEPNSEIWAIRLRSDGFTVIFANGNRVNANVN